MYRHVSRKLPHWIQLTTKSFTCPYCTAGQDVHRSLKMDRMLFYVKEAGFSSRPVKDGGSWLLVDVINLQGWVDMHLISLHGFIYLWRKLSSLQEWICLSSHKSSRVSVFVMWWIPGWIYLSCDHSLEESHGVFVVTVISLRGWMYFPCDQSSGESVVVMWWVFVNGLMRNVISHLEWVCLSCDWSSWMN